MWNIKVKALKGILKPHLACQSGQHFDTISKMELLIDNVLNIRSLK